MARNEPTEYGRDFRCIRDIDEFASEAVGIDVVRQDAIHRITTDDVLGDDGTESLIIVGWGYDVRKLLGMPASRLQSQQPLISAKLLRDPRINSASVRLESTTNANGLADVQLTVECLTALGPFDIVSLVSEITTTDLAGQP